MKSPGGGGRKTQPRDKPRAQCAALPYRLSPGLEFLLVTSRETGRWVIPKGWTMKSRNRRDAAALEAYEEAGVTGRIRRKPLGAFEYHKILRSGAGQACRVTVFALRVTVQHDTWREQDQRSTQWFHWESAVAAVNEPGLKRIMEHFAKTIAKGEEDADRVSGEADGASDSAGTG